MDRSIGMNPSSIEKVEFYITSTNDSGLDTDVDVSTKLIPSVNHSINSTIIIAPSPNEDNLTVTPAFPNFPTDEEVVIERESIIHLEPSSDMSIQDAYSNSSLQNTPHPSYQKFQILNELKYLLKSTNSLATPQVAVQESQEADSAIKRRTVQSDEVTLNKNTRLLIEGLTSYEAKSLGAAERRSNAARLQRLSEAHIDAYSPSPASSTILNIQHEHQTNSDHLPGVIWSFLAAYAFTIIIFLTKLCDIDLIFGFFLQMLVQVIAFSVYAFYKSYHLLGSNGYQIAIIPRALLIGIGTLTSFLAYYYITLPDLSAIRQAQVILTIILSIVILHERITISRIIAFILMLIAIIVLIRPITFGKPLVSIFNLTNHKTSWVPYSSSWNYILGISFALCTAVTYSIASMMNKIYFSTQHLHNTVLCFWSALSGLIISMILVYVTHFVLKDARSFPHDWRLFAGIGLGLASIFVFIANQKAIKREHSSIVTLIYSTDIILALILQNLFTHIKSDLIIIIGCILILVSVLIICIEVLLIEKHKKKLSIKGTPEENINNENNTLRMPSSLNTTQNGS
ncbi:unnamed protein product [Rotaria magnacalcarata]|uniref:EamA domain-containing protein n=2 Tax=Rotaria magnacalcarata TaxID=392030 RepID=A0A816RZB4_9BILA|nr:unnamed protein product [Rotaria magnacalcarata]